MALKRALQIADLTREVNKLRSLVNLLMGAADIDELNAALRLKKTSPSNAELKLWAESSVPPEDLMSQPEVRPW